jgi:polysaccharide biosynthesis transport protein
MMLQRNIPLQTDSPRGPLGAVTLDDQTEAGGIGDLIGLGLAFLRRQYLLIIVTVALALAACATYLRITPPTYTAQVEILLANNRGQFVQQQSLLAEVPFDVSQIETQLQMLKSRAIAVAVIKRLRLEDDPDLNGSRSSLLSLIYRIPSWFAVRPTSQDLDAPGQPPESVVNGFQSRLAAIRIGMSSVVELSFSSSSAERAAEIANATAKAYIDDQLSAKFEANRTATGWLQDRLRDLGEQALAAERALSSYRSQNNIVSTGGKPIGEQQINELNSRLVAARAQTSEALTKLNRYETILNAEPTNSASFVAPDTAGSEAMSNPIIMGLRQQYLELARRESEWSARFGRDHLAVINLKTRMRDLLTSILEEVKRLAQASRSEFEVAKQRQQEIEKQLAEAVSQASSTNSAELTIRDLDGRAKSLRALYETFLQRYMGSVQQETFPIAETRVISPATPPPSKSKPKTGLLLAMGIIGGLAFGVGLGLLRDLMDRVFRTSAQIEGRLDLPCLSLVPLLKGLKPPKQANRSLQADEDLRRRIISGHSAIHHAVVGMPLSRFTEAIRAIKLAIDLNPNKTANQVIGITSALPNEGKTTIAASLAQLIGHSGKKAIIVDCDLRNPSLSASLAPSAAVGLIEVLKGNRSLEEVVWRDPRTNLVFLPAVRRGPLFHTSEILAAEDMRRLFDQLRANYDYVIVDLPPLAPLVDVRATSPLIDCYVLVVEWGRSRIDVVQHALHTAPNVYESSIGVVLNKTDIKAMIRYDTYKSDYYSETHYARYGFSDSV